MAGRGLSLRATVPGFLVAGGRLRGWQNGLALAGDDAVAAGFLGVAGLVALAGADGMVYGAGLLAGYLLVQVLLAEPLRGAGRLTVAALLAERLERPSVRVAAAVATLTVSLLLLVVQVAAAGPLVGALLGGGAGAATAGIVAVGVLATACVALGGMLAATWVRVLRAVLVLGAAAVLSALLLARYGLSLDRLLADGAAVAAASGQGGDPLAPGRRWSGPLDLLSMGLAVALGTAGLPHLLLRFQTVPGVRAARASANWAVGAGVVFVAAAILVGLGAAALVGGPALTAADPSGAMAAPLLAERLGGGPATFGGGVLLAALAAVAFAVLLATASGLIVAAAAVIAHDLDASLPRLGRDGRAGEAGEGRAEPEAAATRERRQAREGPTACGRRPAREARVARVAAVAVGAAATLLALGLRGRGLGVLLALGLAVSASAVLPALLLGLYWRGLSSAGAVAGVLTGLGSSLLLAAAGPEAMGPGGIWLRGAEPLFGLHSPALVAVPLALLAAVAGSRLRPEREPAGRYDDLRLRVLAGNGTGEAGADLAAR